MREETTAFITRPYEQIVADILTAMLSGITNEPIIYDVKTAGYRLSQPASEIRGITGKIDQPDDPSGEAYYIFINNVDYQFDIGRNEVVWQRDGTKPKDDTIFYVDYLLPPSMRRSPITDINVGSVTRTISEAIGREIATLYEQMRLVYLSAYIDTAEGRSLELVVSILGVERKTKDFAVGLATFFRDPSTKGDIDIREGTRVTTEKGDVIFVTIQPRTLQKGQVRISVPIRAAQEFKGEVGQVDANTIVNMFRELEGINRVTNFEATVLGANDETDEELRIRAKAALRALGKGTLLALYKAVQENHASVKETWDPNMPPNRRSDPGQTILLIDTEPERFASVRGAVHDVRSAGVYVELQTRYIYMKPRMIVDIAKGITPDGKDKIIADIIVALQDYIDQLSIGDNAIGEEILDMLGNVDEVSKVTFVDVITSRTDTSFSDTGSLADIILTSIENVVSTEEKRRKIIERLTTHPLLIPSGERIPNRDLVQKVDSEERATDEDIENGVFKVVSKIDGDDWYIALDIEPSDIALNEED